MAERGVNKVTLIGRLGKDPEIRSLPNGDVMATFSVATTDSWKDKSGEQKDVTEWHNVVFFRRLAEIAQAYLKKGARVYIEGSLHTRKYQDKTTGADRYSTDIRGSELRMLGGSANENAGSGGNGGERSARPAAAAAAPMPAQDEGFDDDDIPF